VDTLDLEPGGEDSPTEDPPSSAGRLLLYAVAAVVLIVIGSLVIGHGTATSEPRPGPSPTRQIPPLPLEAPTLTIENACPIRTDHRNELTMSFALRNISSAEATITGLTAIRSPTGLRQIGPTRSGGSCRRTGWQSARESIASGHARIYTVRWALPDTCPEPDPLQVQVTYYLPHKVMEESDNLTVRVDLGGIGFLQCPKAVTDLPTPMGDG
jgi:hypothetical protein